MKENWMQFIKTSQIIGQSTRERLKLSLAIMLSSLMLFMLFSPTVKQNITSPIQLIEKGNILIELPAISYLPKENFPLKAALLDNKGSVLSSPIYIHRKRLIERWDKEIMHYTLEVPDKNIPYSYFQNQNELKIIPFSPLLKKKKKRRSYEIIF